MDRSRDITVLAFRAGKGSSPKSHKRTMAEQTEPIDQEVQSILFRSNWST